MFSSVIVTDHLRKCSECLVEKPLTEFRRKKDGKGGFAPRCKECLAPSHRAYKRSSAGVASRRKYFSSEKGKAARHRAEERRKLIQLDRIRARRKLRKAVERGEVVKPGECSRCGTPCVPEGHHEDYGKPFAVEWLCDKCHLLEHGKNPILEGACV